MKLALGKRKQQQNKNKRAEKKQMTLRLLEFQSNIMYFYYYIEFDLLNLPSKCLREKLIIMKDIPHMTEKQNVLLISKRTVFYI